MEMEDGNRNEIFGTKFTFAVVVRGELGEIQELISFLKTSKLTVAHQQLGQKKLYIKED